MLFAPVFLIACDSDEDSESDKLSVNGTWQLDLEDGAEYLVIQVPSLTHHNRDFAFGGLGPCWDVDDITLTQLDERAWVKVGDDSPTFYRQGDDLVVDSEGESPFNEGSYQRTGQTEEEIAALLPECPF